MNMQSMPLILASTSKFRQELLSRLQIPFETVAPNCDETPLNNETASQTALRLATNKAYSLQNQFPNALIIGSDQVLFANGVALGKPMNVDNAIEMLRSLSGKSLKFYTALVLLNTFSGSLKQYVDETTVKLRTLSDEVIVSYLQREPDAVYCAGAAKSESLGMTLIERIDSSDPNALIGLPMFRLIDFLLDEGMKL